MDVDDTGIVKQSNRVGHSNQRDVSAWCPLSRYERQLQCSESRRLRFGCFVGMQASTCNKLWASCHGNKTAQEKLKTQTGIKGSHVWHCAEVSGDGGCWSDGLDHAWWTGSKKIIAVSRTLTREHGTGQAWENHCHTCLRKTGGNWGTVTHGTGTMQLCGCNCGKVCDLCCLSGDDLYQCTSDACKDNLRKINTTYVVDGVGYFLTPELRPDLDFIHDMFREMRQTALTLDLDEFERRRPWFRVQAAAFNDHIALMSGAYNGTM